MKIEEWKEWMQSEEGQAALDRAAQKMIRSAEHENRWIEKFKSRYEDKLDYAIETLQAKYNSDAYRDKEYRLGREPDERLLWLVWNYAQKYCKPCLDEKYFNSFTAEAFYIGSYVISIMHGQGSVLCLEKQYGSKSIKINKDELLKLYMEWVDKVSEDNDWKTSFGPKEIVYSISNIIENNPQLCQE